MWKAFNFHSFLQDMKGIKLEKKPVNVKNVEKPSGFSVLSETLKGLTLKGTLMNAQNVIGSLVIPVTFDDIK